MQDDGQFAALQDARVDSPVMVRTPEGTPSFWLVPFQVGDQVCGFAVVDLKGEVMQISTLGGGPQDRSSWILHSFFSTPPELYLAEIRQKYPEHQFSEPFFSYDRSPARWAWRLEVGGPLTPAAVVFITPAGWYERRSGSAQGDREG